MTKREEATRDYFISKGLFSCTFKSEAELLRLAKEMLDMLHAPWTRGKVEDTSGVSDLLICYNGRYIAAELKDDIGMPSTPQLVFINKIKAAGGSSAVCRTLSDIFGLVVS